MTFKQLLYFSIIAEEKNFTKASERLYTAQPALSQSISQLEKELEVALLLRTPKGVQLTCAGELLYKYSKKTLQERNSIIRNLSSLSDAYGELSICVKTAPAIISQLIIDFQIKYPNITIHVVTQKTDCPDLIVSSCKDYQNEYVYHYLKKEPYYLLLPKVHPLAVNDKFQISDLEHETLILEADLEFNDVFLHYCRAAGFNPAAMKVCPSWMLIPKMILVYQGCSALLQDATKNLPPEISVKPFVEDITRTVWLASIKNEYEPKAVCLFRKYIIENFAKVYDNLNKLD